MKLRDYIRPPEDNGIGIHWSAANPGAVGSGELRSRWLPELQRMGIRWVKMLHDGGLEFAEMLLDAGIMPIIRLYRSHPNSIELDKAILTTKELEYLRQYIALGVRYFEFNNEPELPTEWLEGTVPANAIDHVAQAAIIDMERILELGGYPGVPATAIGTKWDLIGKIIEKGGKHFFGGPVWLAVHNYDINHPLDYPYDTVNQDGRLLTADEYRQLQGTGAWVGEPWGQRSLDFINQHRYQGANPGDTIHDDPSAFLAYETPADLCVTHLGRPLPILSTENGPIVGEAPDPRYPTTTPASHAEKVIDQAKIMMGTSRRYASAPPYYFCTAFWLVASLELRSNATWERHAWYSNSWPSGRLPAVDALAALAKYVRPEPADPREQDDPILEGEGSSVIAGIILGHPQARIFLRSAFLSLETFSDDRGRYEFTDLPAGSYRLSLPGTDIVRSGLELDGFNQLRVDIREPAITPLPPDDGDGEIPEWRVTVDDLGPSPGFGIIRVTVTGQENLPVRIQAEGWQGLVRYTGSKPEYGPYALEFAPLGAGQYEILPAAIDVRAQVEVDASRVLGVSFAPHREPSLSSASSSISGRVSNGAGLTIHLFGNDVERSVVISPDERYGFHGLPPGNYRLVIPNAQHHRRDLVLDGTNHLNINIILDAVEQAGSSAISGYVSNGQGHTIVLRSEGGIWSQTISERESYRFDHLPPDTYEVFILGSDIGRRGLVLDGSNDLSVDLVLLSPPLTHSVIAGEAPGCAGHEVLLQNGDGLEWATRIDPKHRFSFVGLPSGDYVLRINHPQGLVRQTVILDGEHRLEVSLELPVTDEEWVEIWQVDTNDDGPSPGYGVVRVCIQGGHGIPVRLWQPGWEGMVLTTGERSEWHSDTCEFSPLGAGDYRIEAEGIDQIAEISIQGDRILLVTFRQNLVASQYQILPLKTWDEYLYVGELPSDRSNFLAVLNYVRDFHPQVGSSLEQALQAHRVLILGSEEILSATDLSQLTRSGSEVIHILPHEMTAFLAGRSGHESEG